MSTDIYVGQTPIYIKEKNKKGGKRNSGCLYQEEAPLAPREGGASEKDNPLASCLPSKADNLNSTPESS